MNCKKENKKFLYTYMYVHLYISIKLFCERKRVKDVNK